MSDWIEWNDEGGSGIATSDINVEVRLVNGTTQTGRANNFMWTKLGYKGDIIAYRLAEPVADNVIMPAIVAESAQPDLVNAPPHYKQGAIECIDAIRSALTAEEFRGHCKANAIKYIWRESHKGGDESIRKAIWYLMEMLK